MPRSSHQPTAVLQQTTRLLCLAVWLFAARGIAQQTNALTRSLSLKECIEMALQKNLELQIERHSPQIARYRLGASYGIYDPSFGFAAQRDFLDQPRSFDPKKSGVDFPYELTTDSFSSGISGKLPTGLTYGLGARAAQWDARTDFSSIPVTAANFPPDGIRLTNQYFLSTGIILRQPLLRNFWIDADRLNIQVSRKNLQISEMALLGKIHSTVASVQMAYYELIYALETVKVQNIALELARQFVSETRSQVKLGILPQLEENQAEARFETVRSDLALAEQAVGDRRDNLRNLLIDDIKEWVGVGLEPSEPLLAVEERFERVEGWRNAMMKRPDLLQMKLDLEKQDITLRYDRNQLFPSLDVLGSYGWSAVDHSLDVATDDIGRGAHPTYSYGVVLSVPFSNKKARDNLKATQETKKQALLRLKKLELELLTQVENSGTFLETSLQRVGSTRKARQYSEAALQSEQSKFRAGTTTSFLVLEFQNKLTIARSAEIRALADYNKARAQLAFSEGTTLEKNNITLNLK